MITLNEKGLMAMLYRSFYNRTMLPNNLCAFFWKLILAITLTPVVWPAMILNWIFAPFKWNDRYKSYDFDNSRIPNILGLFINIILPIIGWGTLKRMFGAKAASAMSILWLPVFGAITVSSAAVSIFFLVFIVLKIVRAILLAKKDQKHDVYEENRKWRLKVQKQIERRERWERSFLYLCGQAIIAWKEKYCPRIEWKANK